MGPLQGIKVIELVGIGPGPFVGMLLADMGAQVIAVDRPGQGDVPQPSVDLHRRNKQSIIVDLKNDAGKNVFLDLCDDADALVEGFRPGVVERLGVGPDCVLARNARLVYGRMTGWGQDGPLAHAAGHDISYLSITGALHAIGQSNLPPPPPLNLVGDYGGALFLAFGLVSAIVHARATGKGQVVDAAMVDGVNLMMGLFHGLDASDMWHKQRSANFVDGGAPYYRVYATSDGKFVSLGALEYPFLQEFVEKSGAPQEVLRAHNNPSYWSATTTILEEFFRQRTQREWCELLEGSDACVAPVIPFWEASKHPHNRGRSAFVDIDGVSHPAPAPRFSETPATIGAGPATPGAHTDSLLASLGYSEEKIAGLKRSSAVQ